MKTEKTLRHWLHIILSLLTGGLWLAVYGILIAVNEMNNRVVRGYNQGRADGIRYALNIPNEEALRLGYYELQSRFK